MCRMCGSGCYEEYEPRPDWQPRTAAQIKQFQATMQRILRDLREKAQARHEQDLLPQPERDR